MEAPVYSVLIVLYGIPPSLSPLSLSSLPPSLPSSPSLLPFLPPSSFSSLPPRVYFTPNQAPSCLALVGLPGTEGRLHIAVGSQIQGSKVKLLVPFKQAQCPPGYSKPPTISTIEETCVLNFDFTLQ